MQWCSALKSLCIHICSGIQQQTAAFYMPARCCQMQGRFIPGVPRHDQSRQQRGQRLRITVFCRLVRRIGDTVINYKFFIHRCDRVSC